MVVGRSAPYGPPVLMGPSIGLAAIAGPDEVVEGGHGGRRRRADLPLEPLPEETVPRIEKDDQPGVRLRVRGLRAG
jgi:hypothetical protein